MNSEEKYLLFERYCANELSSVELEDFKRLLESNTALEEEFAVFKEFTRHFEAVHQEKKDVEAFKKMLDNAGTTYFAKEKEKKKAKVISFPFWKYGVAASILVILGVFTFFNKNHPPEYKDFVSIPELTITERQSENKLIKATEMAFNSKAYADAEKLLEGLLEETENTTYQFYYGISLLEQNKHQEASTVFLSLYEGTSVYKYKAIWFEALNQLKQKKYSISKSYLEKIPSTAEDYKKARSLLEALE
ncbi:hypothetical protein HN014_13645 [Aquimarina sp. TRL1]|uniref:hypothetical protein n=1 Tax=Aquimarina sp. (strain TRL1) TaxID=2736252 RepID=UPI001588CD2B|nr:hypothetical protein [Aquimarina sp. TRL1]QKX05905.1 hypothetical protein HN014_13645 [Aquimarina sp. TRL1]